MAAETIRGILTGDSVALGELVVNKMNYVKTVIRNYADRNDMLRNPMWSFVLYVGAKKLVKRKEFEQFLAGRMEI